MTGIHNVGLSPSGNLSEDGPSGGGSGNQQNPITANVVAKTQKLTLRVVFVIASSAFVLMIVCFATIAVILNCRKSCIPSNTGESVFASSINKRSGKPTCYNCDFNLSSTIY